MGEVAFTDRAIAAQIILNLLLNAADAVLAAEVEEPVIWIAVRPAALATRAGESAGAPAGRGRFDAVECIISDNGPGVAPEDRERIFDPFFTTKAPGEGTGLGLSNALRFAEELGGSLELEASGGEAGARFALRIPAHAPPTSEVRQIRKGADA